MPFPPLRIYSLIPLAWIGSLSAQDYSHLDDVHDPDAPDISVMSIGITPRAGILFREGTIELHFNTGALVGYDTNPDMRTDAVSDAYVAGAAGADLRLWLTRNDTLDLDGEIYLRRYADFHDFDRNLGRAGTQYRHIGPLGSIRGDAGWIRTDEPIRPTLDQLLRDEMRAGAGLDRQWHWWSASASIQVENVDFADPDSQLDIYFRDHRQATATIAVTRTLSRRVGLGGALRGDQRDYADTDGSSNGFGGDATGSLLIGEKILATSRIGWTWRRSPDPGGVDISEPTGNLSVRWNWEERSYLGLEYDTSIDDAAAINAFRVTTLDLEARYRLGLYLGLVGELTLGRVKAIPAGTATEHLSARTGIEWSVADGALLGVHLQYYHQDDGITDTWRTLGTVGAYFSY